jgi:hypothetical protein
MITVLDNHPPYKCSGWDGRDALTTSINTSYFLPFSIEKPTTRDTQGSRAFP